MICGSYLGFPVPAKAFDNRLERWAVTRYINGRTVGALALGIRECYAVDN